MAANPKIGTLMNAWQAGVRRPWAISYANGGNYSTAGGNLTLNVPANTASANMQTNTYSTVPPYNGYIYWDLTESQVLVQVNAGTQHATLELWCPQLIDLGGHWFGWHITNGQLQVSYQGAIRASATYSTTTHAWLRILETGGTTYYDYSADGMNWTNLYSVADSADQFCLAGVYPNLYIGSNSSGTNPAGSATFDNFNFPAVPVQIPAYVWVNNVPDPVTTGTTIQSFVDVNGEVWVAKNGVAGGAWKRARDVLHTVMYRTNAYSTATGSGFYGWDTTTSDAYGMYVGGATPGVVVPIAGWWRTSCQVGMGMTAANQIQNVALVAGPSGGTQISADYGYGNGLTSGNLFARSTALTFDAVGDVLGVKISSSTAGLAGLTGALNTNFTVEYVGPG